MSEVAEKSFSVGVKSMNGQQFLIDTAFRDAGNRVIRNLLAEFEVLSENELGAKIDTSVEFLGNDYIRKITDIPYEKDVESFNYTVGKSKFDKDILAKVCSQMKGKWIISVDESIVDNESFVGGIAYRHSCAFGYKIPDPQTPKTEKILAVSSMLRLQAEEDEDFERKMQFLSYLLNLYVAFYTAKILESSDEPLHSIIFHGPLIRQIGPFMNLLFRKEDIKEILTADIEPPSEVADEVKTIANGGLLDLIVEKADYKDGVSRFVDLFAASTERQQKIEQRVNKGEIPGICIYFSLLKKLSDLADKMDYSLIGCVETAHSTEYSRLYVQYQIERFGLEDSDNQAILRRLFETYNVEFSEENFVDQFQEFIIKSGWDDEMIQSFSLRFDGERSIESEFTNPVPIRRYFTSRSNNGIFKVQFGSLSALGDAREPLISDIINKLFPFDKYRMLMSFVRTSELKAPIRVEFLGRGTAETWSDVLASVYVASLPYSSYGLPIFLYYADKMARMPKKITSTVTESYLLDQANRAFRQLGLDGNSLREVFLMVTNKLTRDFHNRG